MSNNRNRNRRRQHHAGQPGQEARGATGQHREFAFHHNGKRYTIPPAATAGQRMKADAFIDAFSPGADEGAELRIMMATLHAAKPSSQTWAALRDMDLPDFQRLVIRWMNETGENLGESEGSSG